MPSAIRQSFTDSKLSDISHPVNRQLSLRALRRMDRLSGTGSGFYRAALLLIAAFSMIVTGCGSGGYAGTGISSLSSSNVTIDAGQSFQVTANVASGGPVDWSLAGASCSAATCGSVSSSTGTSSTYTAPSGITSQLKVTLTAALSGTSSSQTVAIIVNPDPSISGALPAGTVGTPYSATLTAAGGTAPLTWSAPSNLPAGLTFNAKTGVISGTPTAMGSSNFTAQIVDSSDVPYTTKAAETIAISTTIATLSIGGNPGAGTVGAAYSAQLSATGGTAPYSFSVISGSLPNGLTLSSTGAISGTPTAAGTANFTAQVEDASSTKASGS
jgi:Putative Ig domain